MKLKEAINNQGSVVLTVVILVLVVAIWSAMRRFGGRATFGPDSAFYSDDDGKTWFRDKATLATPFDHDGKPACLAHIFRCSGKEFVGYLEKVGDKVVPRESAAPARAPAAAPTPTPAGGTGAAMRLASGPGAGFVKKPGATEWISRGNFRRAAMEMEVKCEGVAAKDIVCVTP